MLRISGSGHRRKKMKTIIFGLLLGITSNLSLADTCDNGKAAMNIDVAMAQYGPTFCPGGCQDVYKIPASAIQSIWYMGKCKKITNLSSTQPVFIPAKSEGFFDANGAVRGHPDLKCVGDFYHTKDQGSGAACQRGVAIKVENCDNPYLVEEIEKECFPGCAYTFTWDDVVDKVDKVTGKVTQVVVQKSETRYFGGDGSPCTYHKRVRLVWDGISQHDPNDSKQVITSFPYILNDNYDRVSCSKPVPACSGSAGSWICYTCIPGAGIVGCDNQSGKWDDVGQNPGEPPPPGHPERSGGTSVSH